MALLCGVSHLFAQRGAAPIQVYGYFQTTLQYINYDDSNNDETTFTLQQLNLFFQKDLAKNWSAFINFEVLNNFSSSRDWGAINLEEAWVKYRVSNELNVKFGLQIPIFNHLNEIKNRTPLLPYVIRPVVYETSFNEFLALEEYAPLQAFLQAYGFFSAGKIKLDYAGYIGNSPNINSDPNQGVTGVDTTDTFLFGGRVGLRYKDLKMGVSGAYDRISAIRLPFAFGNELFRDIPESPRFRFGADVSLNTRKILLEGEIILVNYDVEFRRMPGDIGTLPQLTFKRRFYYGTAGYHVIEPLLVYANWWLASEETLPFVTNDFEAWSIGAAYSLNDRLVFKAQFGLPAAKAEILQGFNPLEEAIDFEFYSVAASVFF
jgi:hypothetical protein